MPIRPDLKGRYPANWNEIARGIKDAADWVCQHCGMQCRRPGEPFDTHRRTMSVAHYPDPDPANCAPENLHALCSGCHNRLDAPMRARNAARTRHRRRACADLFDPSL